MLAVAVNLQALLLVVFTVPLFAEDVSYQACVDKYSRKGYQPWQEWSDHYTCHRYRCEIRDGKYFIAAVGCRKPKIPENALECHEYIEDENVEFPTCCARLRCVVESNGERIVQTRGQPGELFPDKPWKGQPNEISQAVTGGQATALGGGEAINQNMNINQQPGIYSGRPAGKPTKRLMHSKAEDMSYESREGVAALSQHKYKTPVNRWKSIL